MAKSVRMALQSNPARIKSLLLWTIPTPHSVDPLLSANRNEVAAILIHCVNQLPVKLSVVLLMRLEEGLNNAQIAERLNIDKSAAQKRYDRGIAMLRNMPEIQKLNRFAG